MVSYKMPGSKTPKVRKSNKNNMKDSIETINDDYYWKNYDGFKVIIMKKNGYINATKICHDADTKNGNEKEFKHWKANSGASQILNEISLCLGVRVNDLMIPITTGSKKLTIIRGTYVHPMLITHIAYWISPKFAAKVGIWVDEWKNYSKQNELEYYKILSQLDSYQNNNREKIIQKKLQKKLGDKIEAVTPVGKIDLLTKAKLIEIKSFDNWKCALGQLIAYSTFYPHREKHMYLFDSENKSTSNIKKICKANDIKLVIYD